MKLRPFLPEEEEDRRFEELLGKILAGVLGLFERRRRQEDWFEDVE